MEAGADVDWVVLKRLEKPQEGREAILPSRFKKLAESGKSESDTLLRDRQLIQWLALILLTFFLSWRIPWQTCKGDIRVLNDQAYCLSDLADSLTFYQHLVDRDIRDSALEQAETKLIEMQSWAGISPEDSLRSVSYDNGHFEEVFANVSIQFINQGVRNMNQSGDPRYLAFFHYSDTSWLEFCALYKKLAEKYLPTSQDLSRNMNGNLFSLYLDCSPFDLKQPSDTIFFSPSLVRRFDSIISLIDTATVLRDTTPALPDSLSVLVGGQLLTPDSSELAPVTLLIAKQNVPVGSQGTFFFTINTNVDQDSLSFRFNLSSTAYEDIEFQRTIPLDSVQNGRYQLAPLSLSPRYSPLNTPLLPLMVDVPGGRFLMGSPENEKNRNDNEGLHPVRLTSYEIGRNEVTNAEYVRFLNAHADRMDSLSIWIQLGSEYLRIKESGEGFGVEPGYEDFPVIEVSWYGAQAYCHWLNRVRAGDRRGWHLPTEAQWEYAAAGGPVGYDESGNRRQIWAGTSNEDSLQFYAWYNKNSNGNEREVSGKLPNSLGLYDMIGNVWEWCSDSYGDYPVDKGELVDPKERIDDNLRVLRGGSWDSYPNNCRVAFRHGLLPLFRVDGAGFRLARSFP